MGPPTTAPATAPVPTPTAVRFWAEARDGNIVSAANEASMMTALRMREPLVVCPDQHRAWIMVRSEEHTSELQSRQYLVCRLLLEKKKNTPMLLSVLSLNIL